MKKRLMLVVAAVLAAAASAQAQTSDPLGRPGIGPDTVRDAQRDPNPARREDRLISVAEREFGEIEKEARASHGGGDGWMVRAGVVVTNHTSKVIKSVSWAASFTDPDTGRLIRRYDVSTGARIKPGKTKALTKSLPIPTVKVVSAAAPANHKARTTFAHLTSGVTGVTYVDGSTSSAP